jgi:hypothetical protein
MPRERLVRGAFRWPEPRHSGRVKLLLVAGVLALPACSILYNPNNLGDPPAIDAAIDAAIDTPDAEIDAPADAAIDMPTDSPFDAPMLTLTTASPAFATEGVGSGNSRPQLIIVSGTNLVSPTFTIDMIDDGGQQKPVPIVGSRVAADGTRVALAIQVPVLTATAQGMTKPMRVNAAQFGFMTMIDLSINGLDELAPTGTVDTGTLRTQYSRAVFSTATRFIGTAPALIRVTSDISITAPVNADAIGTQPGAHGCGPGGEAQKGGCGIGGGAAGAANSGPGGGGGYGTTGGLSSATAGALTGDAFLLSLTTMTNTAGNRGNGGGGGGAGALGNGGAGGAGAGVLELTADGTVTISGAGLVRAKGGDGTAGGALGGGTGGGGSGGALLIRAGAGISATGAWATAPGGAGGTAGGAGRIRIDTTSTAIPGAPSPAASRGIAWDPNAPTIVGAAAAAVPLIGAATRAYGIFLNGAAQANAMTDATGAVTVNVTLVEGINTLCATTAPGVAVTVAEASKCIQIAYLP